MHECRTLHVISMATAMLASPLWVGCGTSSDDASSAGASGGSSAGSSTGSMGGTDGGASSDAGGIPPGEVPASDDLAGIESFLAAQTYREAPWIAESPAPRDASNAASPHGRVRVWMNSALVASINGGHDGINGDPQADPSSMAVKEIYDANDNQVGLAAMLKQAPGGAPDAWLYFCYGPSEQCGVTGADPTVQAPIFGPGSISTAVSACFYCHGGIVYNKPPTM